VVAFYVETSALIKRYRTEKGTEVVNAVFGREPPSVTLFVSHLVTVEVESAAIRALNGKALNRTAYGVMLRAFAEDLGRMVVLPIAPQLLPEAAQLAREHALRALDALHFATVVRLSRVTKEPIVFVASDRDLLRASREKGFATLDPEEANAGDKLQTIK